MNYKIALVNVFWSEEENNTPYFESANWQNMYFDSLASGKTSPLVNYNMGNNIETTIVFRDTTNRSIDEVVKSNYAIVYTMDGDNIVNRRYFFAYPRQDSGRQMIVNLSLDDVQTNYVQYQGQYTNDVLINRACLNRFKLNSDNTISFDLGNEESPFYTLENFKECGKRLTKRTSLNFEIDLNESELSHSPVNKFIRENILGWEYVYIYYSIPDRDSSANYHNYKVLNPLTGSEMSIPFVPIYSAQYGHNSFTTDVFGGSDLPVNFFAGALACICAPVYKNASPYGRENVLRVGSAQSTAITLSTYGINKFLEKNNNNSYVLARKFSLRPPFTTRHISDTEYTSYPAFNTLVIRGQATSTYIPTFELNVRAYCSHQIVDGDNTYNQGFLLVGLDNEGLRPFHTNEYTIEKERTFNLSDIINVPKNYIFNPKLLGNQFFELNVTNFSQSFTYDYMRMDNNKFRVAYSEALTPDLTKGYARLEGENGLYSEDCEQNLTGLVISNDQSLMVANDQLSNMLANNKNYYLQQALGIGANFLKGSLGAANSASSPNPAAAAAQGASAVASTLISTGVSIANLFLNNDNMRNAPMQVKNANGNIYFASDIQPFKLAIEEYDITEYDKEAFNDYCHMFGFAYGKMGKLSDFVNIRANFNYIEADLINIPIRISNVEKERLKAKFNRGIRFWNNDLVDFSAENYENWVYQKYREVNNE